MEIETTLKPTTKVFRAYAKSKMQMNLRGRLTIVHIAAEDEVFVYGISHDFVAVMIPTAKSEK